MEGALTVDLVDRFHFQFAGLLYAVGAYDEHNRWMSRDWRRRMVLIRRPDLSMTSALALGAPHPRGIPKVQIAMNICVFTASDITPEQWSAFTNATAVPPQSPDEKPIIPYVLVHTPSQEDVTSPTTSLAKPITTSFKSTPWLKIKDCFRNLSSPVDDKIHTQFYLILDEESHQDRKVTVVQRDVEYVTPEGHVWPAGPGSRQDLKTMWVWKRHRVPFEETWKTCALLDVHGGLEEEKWVEEVVKERAEE